MTAPGLQRLEEELRHLKSVERPAIIRPIAEARTHGDLSENAEYHAARERQSFIEGRIAELEEIVSAVEVIDPSTLSGDHVKFGAIVRLVDEETEREATYQIVGVHEADIKSGRLSVILAARQGADRQEGGRTVSVPAPGGDRILRNPRSPVHREPCGMIALADVRAAAARIAGRGAAHAGAALRRGLPRHRRRGHAQARQPAGHRRLQGARRGQPAGAADARPSAPAA